MLWLLVKAVDAVVVAVVVGGGGVFVVIGGGAESCELGCRLVVYFLVVMLDSIVVACG
jgi:hypothetical protein